MKTDKSVSNGAQPFYWRVTFDHPPLNIFGPETIPQLNKVITALES